MSGRLTALKGEVTVSEAALLTLGIVFLFVLPIPHTTTIRLISLFLATLLSFLLLRRYGTPAVPLKVPFAAWTLVAAFSLLYAVDPSYSLSEIKSEVLYSFFAYFVFFTQTRSIREWNAWLTTILAILCVLSVTNVWLWSTTSDATLPRYVYNGVGAYTSFLITALPFIILFLFHIALRGPARWLLRATPLLLLVPIYFTMNRTIWVVLLATALTLTPLLMFVGRSRVPKLGIVSALAAFFIAGLFSFYSILEMRVSLQAHPEVVIERTLAVDPRPGLWEFVVKEIASHPWQGAGFGQDSFNKAHPQWQRNNGLLFHAHNVFLDAGIQMGIPGIAVMLFLFGAVLFEYWRLYRSRQQLAQWIGACGIAMVVAVVTRNMTDEFFRRDLALLFWSLVGASLGYGRRLLVAESSVADQSAKVTTQSASRLFT